MKTYFVTIIQFDGRGDSDDVSQHLIQADSIDSLIRQITDYDQVKQDFINDGEEFTASPTQYLADQEETSYTVSELLDGKLVTVDIYASA